ncbi:hypothetical protein E3N88_27818 [Mikania micrantha]|uniref:BED-type domain-containing protein n=1 Tax=Mikania micrantha TaxID=192012 RepID=A0A5N6MYV7_9ASTR|nr:hypothetical protein E3N88_27818 [Mikania micrantha]
MQRWHCFTSITMIAYLDAKDLIGLTTITSPMDKKGDERDFGFKDPIKGMPAPSPRRRDKLAGLLDIFYMDSDCIKVDLENDSTQNEEVESMDAQDIKDNDDNNVAAKRKRKDRSIVWNYFTKLNQPSIGGKLQCKCNKCKHVFIYDSKTGTVIRLDYLPLSKDDLA